MSIQARAQTGDPFIDLFFMSWGVLVSWIQWIDISALNERLGAFVAALTVILLVYRILLAHEELHDEHSEQNA